MGRYYTGDIEGKFMFGVQASDDASFFGGTMSEPQYINFSFEEDDLEDIEEGLKECVKALGEFHSKIDGFFMENDSYTNRMLAKYLKVSEDDAVELLKWYARYRLGKEIEECVKEHGMCEFEAEI